MNNVETLLKKIAKMEIEAQKTGKMVYNGVECSQAEYLEYFRIDKRNHDRK